MLLRWKERQVDTKNKCFCAVQYLLILHNSTACHKLHRNIFFKNASMHKMWTVDLLKSIFAESEVCDRGQIVWTVCHSRPGCSCPSKASLRTTSPPTWRCRSSSSHWTTWTSGTGWPREPSTGSGSSLPDTHTHTHTLRTNTWRTMATRTKNQLAKQTYKSPYLSLNWSYMFQN